mgnify:CR=1 FL=1
MKKCSFIAALAAIMLAFGGCGTSANNLGGATDGYGYRTYDNTGYYDGYTNGYNGYNGGTYASGGAAYWDGYGVNNGRPMTDNTTGTASGDTTANVAS